MEWIKETHRRATIDLPDGIEYKADNSLIYWEKHRSNDGLSTWSKGVIDFERIDNK